MSKLGKHTSLDKDLKRSVNWIQDFACVTKVVLGRVEAARHKYSPGTLRYKMDSPGGIKVNGYAGGAVFDIYVKVEEDQKEKLIDAIGERWSG